MNQNLKEVVVGIGEKGVSETRLALDIKWNIPGCKPFKIIRDLQNEGVIVENGGLITLVKSESSI